MNIIFSVCLCTHNQHIHKALNVTVMWPIPGQEEIGRSANHYVDDITNDIISSIGVTLNCVLTCIGTHPHPSLIVIANRTQGHLILFLSFVFIQSKPKDEGTISSIYLDLFSFHITCISNYYELEM